MFLTNDDVYFSMVKPSKIRTKAAIDFDVNEQAVSLRPAISSAGFDDSVLTFPTGFEPDFAFDVDFSEIGLTSADGFDLRQYIIGFCNRWKFK